MRGTGMVTFVSYLRTLVRHGTTQGVPGKSPGPWERSKAFRDVLMQVQHKGSCYLKLNEVKAR